MNQYLHKYLVLNQKLSIPDVGNLIIEPHGAQLDVNNGLLFAPAPALHFKQEPTATADKFFYDFLAQEMGVDEVVAIRSFHDYLYTVKSALNTPQGAHLSGIGQLRKENNGYILFTPETTLNELMPQVKLSPAYQLPQKEVAPLPDDDDAHRELTEQEEEDIRELLGQESQEGKADYWWVYAIILLLIGIGALLFYYV
ncbi:MAG: hypothetical protein JNK08_00205 [Sediminibacterium sp.]|nr:hypothetical protein [Sediminibacterium sp.]